MLHITVAVILEVGVKQKPPKMLYHEAEMKATKAE